MWVTKHEVSQNNNKQVATASWGEKPSAALGFVILKGTHCILLKGKLEEHGALAGWAFLYREIKAGPKTK